MPKDKKAPQPHFIMIAAGGTGGHFFPAEALASILIERGYRIGFMTDARTGKRSTGIFSRHPQWILKTEGFAGRSLVHKLLAIKTMLKESFIARSILKREKIIAVVGFGGYPAIPPALATRTINRRNRPVLILHEGNAILGLANAVTAYIANVVAISFPECKRLPGSVPHILTGMPVRPDIRNLYKIPYHPPKDRIRLLIWGGSLGAQILGEIIPQALARLPKALRQRLTIVQQIRADQFNHVKACYQQAGITFHLEVFIQDIAVHLKQSHFVIGRSGGSSLAELAISGRPSLLIPYPYAASNEQFYNAQWFEKAGAATILLQKDMTVDKVAAILEDRLCHTNKLAASAKAARTMAHPNAASDLAELVISQLPLAYRSRSHQVL